MADDLRDIARTDQLLDELAGLHRARPADRAEAELFALLEGWRDGVRGPSDVIVTESQAAEALQRGLAAQPEPARPRRSLALVASIAATVLALGGFGALVGTAGPGDSLYGLRTALFGESATVRDDRVTLAAQTKMAEVQELINRGDWEQAQAKLAEVGTSVQTVDNPTAKTELIEQWNQLSVKVGTRDPNATLPPTVPGEPAAPPPPGVTLIELPVTTTTSAPDTSAVTTTVPTSETTTSAPVTTSGAAPSSTSPTPSSTVPSSETTVTTPPTSEPASSVGTTAPATTAPATTPPATTAPAASSAAAPSPASVSAAPAPTPTVVAPASPAALPTPPTAPVPTPAATPSPAVVEAPPSTTASGHSG